MKEKKPHINKKGNNNPIEKQANNINRPVTE